MKLKRLFFALFAAALLLAPRPAWAVASASGTLSTTGTVVLSPQQPDNVVTVQISGTYTGATALFQGSLDGTNWANISGTRMDTGVIEQTPTTANSSVIAWKFDCTNMLKVRFNLTALSTGSIVVVMQANNFNVDIGPLPANTQSVTISASSTGAAQANNASLAAVAGKTTYITGFDITGTGATAASVLTITVTGVGTTQNYSLLIPAGVTTNIAGNSGSMLSVRFPQPIPASAVNTAIVVNCPSFGAGNTNASCTAYGFQQ
jgi:hypothetical protein